MASNAVSLHLAVLLLPSRLDFANATEGKESCDLHNGDYHGGMERWKLEIEQWPDGSALTKDDYLIVAGDFGLWWLGTTNENYELKWLDGQPWTTLFVDGNHEGFSALYDLPVERWHGGETSVIPGTSIRWLRRGQIFELDGCRILTMGGATSVDRSLRVEGYSWFAEELPSEVEMQVCRDNLDACGWTVDCVVTHTCATSLLARALYPDLAW